MVIHLIIQEVGDNSNFWFKIVESIQDAKLERRN